MSDPLLNRRRFFLGRKGTNGIGVSVIRRTVIVAAIAASVILFGHAAQAEWPGDASLNVKPVPCVVEAGTSGFDCRRLLDELCDAADAAGPGVVWITAHGVASYYATTPRGAACLREMLRDPRPARAAFASGQLVYSGDFGNIEPLLACAERYADNDRVVEGAITAVEELVATGSHGPYEPGKSANLDAVRRVRAWLKEARGRGILAESYEEFWGAYLKGGLKELLKKQDWELEQGVCDALRMLSYSRDSGKAASLLFGCVGDLEEGHYKTWVTPALFRSLQFHVGPLDHPPEGDITQNKRTAQKALEWWGQNKGKRPVDWMLGRLALRGYATATPDNAKTTADALVRALAKGRPAEQYAAMRVLGFVLPDGDSLPAFYEYLGEVRDAGSRDAPEQKPEHNVSAREYCVNVAMCRAMRWATWECVLHAWDNASGRYVRKKATDDKGTDDKGDRSEWH